MITRQWKFFVDYEKEEKWLNEKSAKGFAMTHYSPFHYTFEDCAPGEYIYRIDLLKNRAAHPDSARYIRFMEESGAQEIATWVFWVYFRKKAADGPFEIYSDISSRLQHYRRLVTLYLAAACLLLLAILTQIPAVILLVLDGVPFTVFKAVLYALLGALLVLELIWFLIFFLRYVKRVRSLKRERDIRE